MEDNDVYMLCVDIAARRVPDADTVFFDHEEMLSDVDQVLIYADNLFAALTKKLVNEASAR